MLREFATKTKDKDVTIVVQAAYPLEGHTFAAPKQRLETYVIKNGTIECVAKGKSSGFAKDLENLLSFTGKNHPSQKLGLIIDSHGIGNEGLVGDTGRATLGEFVDAVRTGLKQCDKTKLDLVDFDCCLMGQNGVLNKIRDVAVDVVAAAETESTEGQNLIPPLEHLLDNPKTDGRQLALDLIKETRKQADVRDKTGGRVPIESLSYFNLREYGAFAAKLDAFGEKLSEAIKVPASRETIERCIDESRSYGSRGGLLNLIFGIETKLDRKDLKNFSERIIANIDAGKIKDTDGTLKKAATEVLETRKTLVEAYFGHGTYRDQGGLSVFLPGRDLRNTEHVARIRNPAGRIAILTEATKFDDINKSPASRLALLNNIERELNSVRPRSYLIFSRGVEGVEKETKGIEDAAMAFRKADSDPARREALEQLNKAAQSLEKTDNFDKLRRKTAVELRVNAANEYTAQLVGNGKTGWSKFRIQLRDTAAKP